MLLQAREQHVVDVVASLLFADVIDIDRYADCAVVVDMYNRGCSVLLVCS